MPKRLSTPIGVYPSHTSSLHRLPLQGNVDMVYRVLGVAEGAPWLVLHGGPGSGANPTLWQAFDLAHHRVWVPDQRGSGASRPRGTLRGQHIQTLVADLERLRIAAGVTHWKVLGGSWGATLAVAYAAQHPKAVASLVLRGSFTASRSDVSHLLGQMLYPGPQRRLVPLSRVQPLLHQLSQLFRNGTPRPANSQWAQRWQIAERQLSLRGQWRAWLHSSALAPEQRRGLRRSWAQLHRAQRSNPGLLTAAGPALVAKYRIQAHHLARRCRLRPTDWNRWLRTLAQHKVPVTWVHGRFDAVCPPRHSQHSHAVLANHAATTEWAWAHAGHLGMEPDMLRVLRQRLSRS